MWFAVTMDRARSVAKFQNNTLEAEGLALVRHAIEADGRLTIEKCFEGARADFVVHTGDPDKALGVQLKTTRHAKKCSVNSHQYRFTCTAGYDGLAVLCIALDSRVRMWLVKGCEIGNCLSFPTEYQTTRRKYGSHETFELDLVDDFLTLIHQPGDLITLSSVKQLVEPSSRNGRAEFKAYQHLTTALPLDYRPAPTEGLAYDCLVNGQRWQLKLATLNKVTDRYSASAQKAAGRQGAGKKRKHSQYAEDDFEWLCVQLPAHVQIAYLLPMSQLVAHGLAGRPDCSNATLHFYPHRCSQTRTEWLTAYQIDLSDQGKALADYKRIRAM